MSRTVVSSGRDYRRGEDRDVKKSHNSEAASFGLRRATDLDSGKCEVRVVQKDGAKIVFRRDTDPEFAHFGSRRITNSGTALFG